MPGHAADSGGCRFGEHLPGIPDNGAVADQTGIVKPFQKNLTLVDTSNFSSRRRTYSPPIKWAVVSPSGSCALRGFAAPLEPYVQCHTCCHCPRSFRKYKRYCVCNQGTNCTLPCANCLRKSATTQGTPFGCGSFIAEIGAAFTAPIFFFKKETKIVLRHRKEENSELFPFRSKSCESWRRPFCDSSCRLCILFPTLQ